MVRRESEKVFPLDSWTASNGLLVDRLNEPDRNTFGGVEVEPGQGVSDGLTDVHLDIGRRLPEVLNFKEFRHAVRHDFALLLPVLCGYRCANRIGDRSEAISRIGLLWQGNLPL